MLDSLLEISPGFDAFHDIQLVEGCAVPVDKEFNGGDVLLELDDEADARGDIPVEGVMEV